MRKLKYCPGGNCWWAENGKNIELYSYGEMLLWYRFDKQKGVLAVTVNRYALYSKTTLRHVTSGCLEIAELGEGLNGRDLYEMVKDASEWAGRGIAVRLSVEVGDLTVSVWNF